jgi:hypothetical protein
MELEYIACREYTHTLLPALTMTLRRNSRVADCCTKLQFFTFADAIYFADEWTDLSRDGKTLFRYQRFAWALEQRSQFRVFLTFFCCTRLSLITKLQFRNKTSAEIFDHDKNKHFPTYVYKTASSSHNPSENLNFDGRLCLENEISVR